MKYVIRDCNADLEAPLGGKARALAALRVADLPIPAWFVVRPEAFHDSLSDEQRHTLDRGVEGAMLRGMVDALQPSSAVCADLAEALAALCPDGAPVAVRSSASDEDGVQHSFAGQLDSFLFVSAADVPAKIAAVWR